MQENLNKQEEENIEDINHQTPVKQKETSEQKKKRKIEETLQKERDQELAKEEQQKQQDLEEIREWQEKEEERLENLRVESENISQEHLKVYKPINILLNCKFERGELYEGNDPITIFRSKLQPKPIKDIRNDKGEIEDFYIAEEEEENNFNFYGQEKQKQNQQFLNRAKFDEGPEPYKSVSDPLNPYDGFLYHYSKFDGQEELDSGETFSKIKMLICVTMYAESRSMLELTLKGVQRNIREFEKVEISPEQIVVVVLQDGIMKMKDELVEYYCERDLKREIYCKKSQLKKKNGIYDVNILDNDQNLDINTVKARRKFINDEINLYKKAGKGDVLVSQLPPSLPLRLALLYQERENFFKDDQDEPHYEEYEAKYPLNVLYLNKHLNAKKLSSHMWFFEGFCRQLQPSYCAFIDVGTVPEKDSLVKYYRVMEGDENIGGVSGFLGLYNLDEQKEDIYNTTRLKAVQYKKKAEQEKIDAEKKKKEEEEQRRNRNNSQNQNQQQNQIANNQNTQKQPETAEEYKRKNNQSRIYNKYSVKLQPILENLQEEEENAQAQIYQEDLKAQNREIYMNQIAKKRKQNVLFWTIPFIIIFSPFLVVYYIIYYFLVLMVILYKFLKKCLYLLHEKTDLKKAQKFEYTLAHMIDKNFESFFGFLHVLPGAWSAYRYDALAKGSKYKENLLQKKYLKQMLNPDNMSNDYREANMYLAEDRILCLGIYCQIESKYTLKYIPDAVAKTDAVDTFAEFINQRRRWINSSWFALDYVLRNYSMDVQDSAHPAWSKRISLPFNMLMARLQQLNMYILLGLYLFVVCTIVQQVIDSFLFLDAYYSNDCQILYKCVSKDAQNRCLEKMVINDGKTDCIRPDQDYLDDVILQWKSSHQWLMSIPWFIPTIYILVLLNVIFASLTFKIKKVNEKLDSERKIKLKFDEIKLNREKLKRQIDEIELNDFLDKNNATETQIKKNTLDKKQRKDKLELELKKLDKEEINVKGEEAQYNVNYSLISMSGFLSVFGFFAFVMLSILGILKCFSPDPENTDGSITVTQVFTVFVVFCNMGMPALIIFFHLNMPSRVWDIISSTFAYLVYAATYFHTLVIFAFCNIDDVTWGTKGVNDSEVNDFFQSKIAFVSRWLVVNALLTYFLLTVNSLVNHWGSYVIVFIFGYASLYIFLRVFFGTLYHFLYFCNYKKQYDEVFSLKRKYNKQQMEKMQNEYNAKTLTASIENFSQQFQNSMFNQGNAFKQNGNDNNHLRPSNQSFSQQSFMDLRNLQAPIPEFQNNQQNQNQQNEVKIQVNKANDDMTFDTEEKLISSNNINQNQQNIQFSMLGNNFGKKQEIDPEFAQFQNQQ